MLLVLPAQSFVMTMSPRFLFFLVVSKPPGVSGKLNSLVIFLVQRKVPLSSAPPPSNLLPPEHESLHHLPNSLRLWAIRLITLPCHHRFCNPKLIKSHRLQQ